MAQVLDVIGRVIARYLERPVQGYEPFTSSDPVALRKSLEPGDVLLVEGNSHISRVIKYLTQSTWSHAALYVGPIQGANTQQGEPHVLIEAEIGQGVISAPLSKYYRYHTRICRPIGLSLEDRRTVCSYAIDRIGFDYDLRNVIDLMRYLFPLPVPQRWRRRVIALGSGTPTRLICSALIAQLSRPSAIRFYRKLRSSKTRPRDGRFWRSAIRRSMRRAISISRRTSRSSNRPWPRSSTINACIGPICRHQATSMSRHRRECVG